MHCISAVTVQHLNWMQLLMDFCDRVPVDVWRLVSIKINGSAGLVNVDIRDMEKFTSAWRDGCTPCIAFTVRSQTVKTWGKVCLFHLPSLPYFSMHLSVPPAWTATGYSSWSSEIWLNSSIANQLLQHLPRWKSAASLWQLFPQTLLSMAVFLSGGGANLSLCKTRETLGNTIRLMKLTNGGY